MVKDLAKLQLKKKKKMTIQTFLHFKKGGREARLKLRFFYFFNIEKVSLKYFKVI